MNVEMNTVDIDIVKDSAVISMILNEHNDVRAQGTYSCFGVEPFARHQLYVVRWCYALRSVRKELDIHFYPNQVIAYLLVFDDEWITWYTHPRCRGMGIGTGLLRRALHDHPRLQTGVLSPQVQSNIIYHLMRHDFVPYPSGWIHQKKGVLPHISLHEPEVEEVLTR